MTVFTAQDSGICLNAEDLLLRLKTLTEANGFTVENYSDNIISGNTRGKRLHLSKSGKYYNFCGVSGEAPTNDSGADADYATYSLQSLSCNISTAFNLANNWYRNTGASSANTDAQDQATIRSIQVANNSNYWIYVSSKAIVVITKFNSINYSILYAGELDCYSATDSLFITTASSETYDNYYSTESILRNRRPFASQNATNQTSFILNSLNLDTTLTRLYENHYSSVTTNNYPKFTIDTSAGTGLITRSDNTFNGTSLLFPIEYYKKDTSTADMYPIGQVENVFIVNMKNHQPETIFNIGTNEYIVFPFNKKYSPHAYNNEGYGLGIAIKIGE